MRVALFAGKFPALSETFVIRQALSILNGRHDISVISSDVGDGDVQHAEYLRSTLSDRVSYIRGERPSRFALVTSMLLVLGYSLLSVRSRHVFVTILMAAKAGCWSSVIDLLVCFRKFRAGSGFGKFDFIIAHFGPIGVRTHYLKLAGYIEGPISVVFHGADMSEYHTIKKYKRGYESLFSSGALLLPISKYWKNRLMSWGADERNIEVLRMGVKLPETLDDRIRKPVERPLRILSVARFTEKKGLKYALSGFLSSNIEAVYSIIGSGPQEPELRKLAEEAGEGKRVRFLGKCTQEEVFAALDETDVFLLPSVTATSGDMEGIPVALMEAMSRGVLVIATDHSGIPELVVDGTTGFLVPERDPEAISEVLNRIDSGKDDIFALRTNALATLRQDFDADKLDQQLERIINQAVLRSAA